MTLIFSNYNYYRNTRFQHIMRNWNNYINSDCNDDEVLAQWEEELLKDFRDYANQWRTSHSLTWGYGLE